VGHQPAVFARDFDRFADRLIDCDAFGHVFGCPAVQVSPFDHCYDQRYHDLLISLNTSKTQRILTLIKDGRRNLLTAALAGFGRAIGEVGAIMIVGGNIDQVTRVLTTAIALETGKGDFALALGLGFVLIGLAIIVNIAIHSLSRTEREGRW